MADAKNRLDEALREARQDNVRRAAGYRAQALKLYPWVCGGCARTFTHANLQLLEVHHKNGNHDDNPPDGSNWELLCVYCHDNEHARQSDHTGVAAIDAEDKVAPATGNPFAGLRGLLGKKD